jgi:hypothetical protein
MVVESRLLIDFFKFISIYYNKKSDFSNIRKEKKAFALLEGFFFSLSIEIPTYFL